jgi:hypothetical protein
MVSVPDRWEDAMAQLCLPLTDDDLAELARLRTAGPERAALAVLASGELPAGDDTEAALVRAVFVAGLRAVREWADDDEHAPAVPARPRMFLSRRSLF